MKRTAAWTAVAWVLSTQCSFGQNPVYPAPQAPGYAPSQALEYAPPQASGYAPAPAPGYSPAQDSPYSPGVEAYTGMGSIGSGEPLYRYDDQERWKHGYIQEMPYYGGHNYFRPYNYHHVFGQSRTAVGWGMPAVAPYSQQFWHKYEKMTDLSKGDHSPVAPLDPPVELFDHYPKPYHHRSSLPQTPEPERDPGQIPADPQPQAGPMVLPTGSQVRWQQQGQIQSAPTRGPLLVPAN